MKRSLITLFCSLCLMVSAPIDSSRGNNFQGIAAIVNDDVISMLDLDSRMTLFLKSLGIEDSLEVRDQIRQEVLQSLIDERLQIQQASRLGLQVGNSEITETLSTIAAQNGFQGGNLDTFFLTQGIEIQTLEDQIRARLLWNKVIENTIIPTIEISPQDVTETLERMQNNSGNPEYLVADIFLNVESSASEDAVKTAMNGIMQRIIETQNFPAIASEFSESASAQYGGDLGWIQKGDIDDTLWQALSEMELGEISKPIRSLQGYHLILLRDSRIAGEDMIPKLHLKQILFPQEISLPQDILAGTLQPHLSDCETLPDMLADETINPHQATSQDLGILAVDDLPLEIRQTVQSLEAGTMSEPLTNDTGVMILFVCERFDPKQDDAVQSKIEERLLLQRVDLASRRHLNDLRRIAHIDTRTGG